MSADRWSVCPKCLDILRAESRGADAALDDQYGKVGRAEFKALEAEAKRADAAYQSFAAGEDRTFREDYEFYGAREGTVTASYSGSCNACGLEAKFEHAVPFYTPEAQP